MGRVCDLGNPTLVSAALGATSSVVEKRTKTSSEDGVEKRSGWTGRHSALIEGISGIHFGLTSLNVRFTAGAN